MGKKIQVIKRNGEREDCSFDQVRDRIETLSEGLENVNADQIAQDTIRRLYDGIKTSQLDQVSIDLCAHQLTVVPDYETLAVRLCISNLHKETPDSFTDAMTQLYLHYDEKRKRKVPVISQETMDIVLKHSKILDDAIVGDNDYNFSFFGFKTLERAYLLKAYGKIVERPQSMYMRVAIGIHGDDLPSILETYKDLTEGFFIMATPTLFNSGTPNPQMSSCFLIDIKGDSLDGIYDTLKDAAMISKTAGGVGIAVHKIRAAGSYIAGTGGYSNGLAPMLRVFNNTARYVDQGNFFFLSLIF
jgi:ribonucleotide reductase alpha subunit